MTGNSQFRLTRWKHEEQKNTRVPSIIKFVVALQIHKIMSAGIDNFLDAHISYTYNMCNTIISKDLPNAILISSQILFIDTIHRILVSSSKFDYINCPQLELHCHVHCHSVCASFEFHLILCWSNSSDFPSNKQKIILESFLNKSAYLNIEWKR